jgi:hypothetical protein
MTHDNHSVHSEKKSLWYTYLGKGGASAVAFLWILALLFWVFAVLMWG